MAGGSALNTTHRGLPGGEERLFMVRRGRALQYLTIAWNSGECVVSLTAGVFAGSIATVGIVLAALSLIVMPLLVYYKRRVASQLGSGALEAEARQTRVCAYLSAILLVGLGLNAWLGYWWADPVAGVAMVPLIAWEGLEAVRGRTCCVT